MHFFDFFFVRTAAAVATAASQISKQTDFATWSSTKASRFSNIHSSEVTTGKDVDIEPYLAIE